MLILALRVNQSSQVFNHPSGSIIHFTQQKSTNNPITIPNNYEIILKRCLNRIVTNNCWDEIQPQKYEEEIIYSLQNIVYTGKLCNSGSVKFIGKTFMAELNPRYTYW